MFFKLLAVVLFAGSAYGWGFDPRQAGRNGYDSYGRYTGTSTQRNGYGNQWRTTSRYYNPYPVTSAAPSRIIDRMTSYSTYIAVQVPQRTTRRNYNPYQVTTSAIWNPYGNQWGRTSSAVLGNLVTSQYGYMGPYGPYGPNGAPINGGFQPGRNTQYGYMGPYGPYGPNGPINGGFQPGRFSRVFYTVSRPAAYATNIFAGIPSSLAPFPLDQIPPPLDARGTKCGGTYKVGNGATFIKSPNFPNHYPRLETCVYKFTAPKGKRVKITFTSMNVEMHKRCVWDSIAVINGGPKGQQVAKICGNTNRGFTLKGRAGTLIFRTDGSVQKNGWRAKLTAV